VAEPPAAVEGTSANLEASGREGTAKASGLFDRILVKPRDRSLDGAQVTAIVEAATGEKVAHVRRSGSAWFLVGMAPKARAQADQERLVQVLARDPALAAVEADRLLQMKRP